MGVPPKSGEMMQQESHDMISPPRILLEYAGKDATEDFYALQPGEITGHSTGCSLESPATCWGKKIFCDELIIVDDN